MFFYIYIYTTNKRKDGIKLPTKNYALTLKNMVTLTQTKLHVLAEVVGYDISYISKWSSGIKLPSSRCIEQVNEAMSLYFAKSIILHHKQENFCDTFNITAPIHDGKELNIEIQRLLCAAYQASIKGNQLHKPKEKDSLFSKIVIGKLNATMFLSKLLQEELSQVNDTGDLLVFGEFCTLADMGLWNYFDSVQLNASRITIRVGLDVDKLDKKVKYMQQLYWTLNAYLDYDFMFYDSQKLEHTNLIILKDRFVVQYSLNADDTITMCSCISDKDLVQTIYDEFILSFVHQPCLITPMKSLGMNEMGFRTGFYATNHFSFFLTNGIEFLLPRKVFDSIINSIDESTQSQDLVMQVERLRVTWEELLDRVDVDFIIPTTSIIRYIETGYIYLTDIEYNLTLDERKEHYTSILNAMKSNHNITMGIINSSVKATDYQGYNLSFYSNHSSCFFKKNKQYIHNDAYSFYVITNKRLLDIIQKGFDYLKKLPMYHTYSADEITKTYEMYQSLITRMLTLREKQ